MPSPDLKPDILILAAGASKRLGFPKQLVHHQGQSLIKHLCQRLSAFPGHTIYCALGAHSESIQAQLPNTVIPVFCENWENGMGASLSDALEFIQNHGEAHQLLICLSDQFLIPDDHYRALLRHAQRTPDKIIATIASDRVMVPAIFPASWFDRLGALDGDQGARKILAHAGPSKIKAIACEAAITDLDTPEDIAKFPDLMISAS